MRKHIALVGFMASGKSTIGKRLARKLHIGFVDIDDIVAQDHGAIGDIFFAQGEEGFRRYEYDAIAHALDQEPAVLALGGGAVTYPATLQLLRKRAYRVFIKVGPEQILGRLRRSPRVRPLLGPAPSLSKVRDLYTARLPSYAHADLTVEATDLKTADIVERIVEWVHKRKIAL